jgi:signal transduction histidine kinase
MNALRRIRARYREMDPFKADLALALLLVAAFLGETLLVDSKGDSRLVTAIVGVLAIVPAVSLRRRNTLVAAASFGAVSLAQEAVDSFFLRTPNTPFVVILIMLYSVGRHATGWRFWAAAGSLYAGVGAALMIDPDGGSASDLLWLALMFTPPVLAGRAMRSRVLLQSELRESAERAEAEREQRARDAVEDERARIASELQAVVANGVSAMVVQAEAVPRVLAAGDTASAGEALAVIEETGRDALAEMRRLLGVLRRDGDGIELAPQPGLARLPSLADRVREEGMEVDLEVCGEPRDLSMGVDLTAFRLLQEALAWAADSGAGRADVTIRYGDDGLELRISDDRAGEQDEGAALVTMRERAGLYGGHVRAGRGERDGFAVEARIPARRGEG